MGQGGLIDVAAREVASSLLGEALLVAAGVTGRVEAGRQRPSTHGAAWRLSGVIKQIPSQTS